jgi:hypothetical protein
MDNITTIQLRENVKVQLDLLKEGKESYEEVILRLMLNAERCLKDKKEFLIEGCLEMAEENLKITREFEAIEDLSFWTCDNLIPKKYLKKGR